MVTPALLTTVSMILAVLVTSVGPALARSGLLSGPGAPTGLTVDGAANPLGIDDPTPQFSWIVSDTRPDALQAAYEIVVSRRSSASAGPGVIWDSGKVVSDQQAYVSYGGVPLQSDENYDWTVRTWDRQGVPGPFAQPATFVEGLQDSDWKADWIRLGADPSPLAGEQYAYVRKNVSPDASPIVAARAYVSASDQYELWIDGRLVDRGQSFAYPDSQYYQTTDIASWLQPGRSNTIGFLYHWYGPGKGRPTAPSGLIAQISVHHQDGTHELLITDGSWHARSAEWQEPVPLRNDEGDRVEHIDGDAYPTGWDIPGYDDSSWTPVTVVGPHPIASWTHLRSQSSRVIEQLIHPVSVKTFGGGIYVADFGSVIAARPMVSFSHGARDRQIPMTAGYVLEQAGLVSTIRGTQSTDMSYQYTERRGAQTFVSYGYLGFRYLEVDNPGETLDRRTIAAFARHAAMPDENAASFFSPSSTLNAVWSLTRHSALYGSQEQFIDTPTREKGPFLRDGYNISSTAMRAFGERVLTQQALVDFAQSQSRFWPDGRVNYLYPTSVGAFDIPDFTEIFPDWVMRYYEETGNSRMLEKMYPVMVNVSDYIERYISPSTGLVTNIAGGGTSDYQYGIVDWPPAMRYGYDMSTSARTAINELAVNCFDDIAKAARELGQPTSEIQLQAKRASALTTAINAHLTKTNGIYVDGLLPNGAKSSHASQLANSYAIAYGIVTPSHLAAVSAYLSTLGLRQGPMTAETLLAALHDSGRDADLIAVITDTSRPGWGYIVSHGGTFTWESWTPSDLEGDSMSHGWGSTALVDIQQDLLGVRPTAPGFADVEIRPPTGGLAWASGTVASQHGPIRVSWQRPDASGEPVRLSVTVPANTAATVVLPAAGPRSVTEGDRPLAHDARARLVMMEGSDAVVAIGSGSYSFASSPPGSSPGRWTGSATVLVLIVLLGAALATIAAYGITRWRRRRSTA